MKVVVKQVRRNPLLKRKEIVVEIDHPGKATPTREEVRKHVAALLDAPLETTVVIKIKSTFGLPKSEAYLHIYDTKEDMFRFEQEYILKRNGIIGEGNEQAGKEEKA